MHICHECGQTFADDINFFQHSCILLIVLRNLITALKKTNESLTRIAIAIERK